MKVFLGGTIYPMAGDAATVEAVAVDGRTIVAVGSREAVLHQAGPGATVSDLQGQTLIPGFIDAHHHLSIAVLYEGAADCRQGSVRSIAEIQQRLQAAATTLPPDAWVIGYGYDAFMLSDRRHPTRHDLDAACPDHPVMLMHFSFHQCVANSKALALAGIGRACADPTGGIIERQANGLPNGILLETAMAHVESLARHDLAARDADGFRARLRRYQTQLFAAGITRLADAAVSADLRRMYQDAKEAGDLRMPVVMMPVAEGGYLAHPWDCLDGPVTGEGSDELRMGPLKLIFDGGENCAVCLSVVQIARIAGRTLEHIVRTGSLGILKAFSRGKLRWGRDGHLHSGIRHYPDDETAIKLAQKAADRGFSLAIHAMGNEAVAQALRVHSAVRQPRSDVPPPRIEHLTMADPALLTSVAGQGITAVVQPGFVDALTDDGFPPLPDLKLLALRSLLDAGIPLAGSSDAPVVRFAPLAGLQAALDRRNASGTVVGPEEAPNTLQVLAMYTREAAIACGCLDVTGTIEPGKRADLVVLSGDPCHSDPARLGEIQVRETLLAGETVYRSDAS